MLNRPGMHVKCKELQRLSGRFRRRFAAGEGLCRWHRGDRAARAKDNTRTGTAEHSEYYTGDQKVVLRGGRPKLVRHVNGNGRTAQGAELTYFANDDRLLVNGAPDQPVAKSQCHRRA